MITLPPLPPIIFHNERLFLVRHGRDVPSQVTYVDGKPRFSPKFKLFACIAGVQPTSGEDLQRLPEGVMRSGSITVWTQDLTNRLELGDLVTRFGITYQCQDVRKWPRHTKAVFAADETLDVFNPLVEVPFA